MAEPKSQSLWIYLEHADNLHTGRINFSLVIEAVLVAAFVQILSSDVSGTLAESTLALILFTLSLLGTFFTLAWYWTNFRLSLRISVLTNYLMKEEGYRTYIRVVPKHPSSNLFLTYLFPVSFYLIWVLSACGIALKSMQFGITLVEIQAIGLCTALVLSIWAFLYSQKKKVEARKCEEEE